jgi:hypothetical protein
LFSSFALVDWVVEVASESGVNVEDKLFYKSITFTFNGKTKNIGWGAFGIVSANN